MQPENIIADILQLWIRTDSREWFVRTEPNATQKASGSLSSEIQLPGHIAPCEPSQLQLRQEQHVALEEVIREPTWSHMVRWAAQHPVEPLDQVTWSSAKCRNRTVDMLTGQNCYEMGRNVNAWFPITLIEQMEVIDLKMRRGKIKMKNGKWQPSVMVAVDDKVFQYLQDCHQKVWNHLIRLYPSMWAFFLDQIPCLHPIQRFPIIFKIWSLFVPHLLPSMNIGCYEAGQLMSLSIRPQKMASMIKDRASHCRKFQNGADGKPPPGTSSVTAPALRHVLQPPDFVWYWIQIGCRPHVVRSFIRNWSVSSTVVMYLAMDSNIFS